MRSLFALIACLPAAALGTVHYRIAPDPAAKTLAVSIVIDNPSDAETFRIPAWSPGFYFLESYEKKISDVKATDPSGAGLSIDHSDPRAWVVHDPNKKPITLSYRVLGDDPGLGFFAVNIKDKTGFLNGPAAYMYVPDRLTEDTDLKVDVPSGWDVATPMDKVGDRYVANGYDELADQPVQMGEFTRKSFNVAGIPFEAIWVAPNNDFHSNLDAETARLQRVSLPAIKMFGGAPFKRYIYFIHLAVGNFAGGLEHRACNVEAIGNARTLNLDDLAAHEFFHAWNVKQIRRKVLGPFDYTKEVKTANLWFAEGVTDYYSKLDAYESGLKDEEWLADELGGEVRNLQMSRVRKTMTLEECSRAAWENGGFGVGDLSYYNKGLLAGFIFDAAIRGATHGAKSLDDVMRLLYARHRLPKPGYEEDELEKTINEVAGKDLTPLYHQIVQSTEEMPYGVVGQIGLKVLAPGDKYVSMPFDVENGRVSRLLQDSKLQIGDEVLGEAANAPDGSTLLVRVRRGTAVHEIEVPATLLSSSDYRVIRNPLATPAEKALLEQWLKRPQGIEQQHG